MSLSWEQPLWQGLAPLCQTGWDLAETVRGAGGSFMSE